MTYPRLAGRVLPARKIAVVAAFLGVALLHTALVVLALRSRADVQNIDYWYHLYVGTQQDWSVAHTLAHGFYPLGYPWLLRTGIDYGIDGVRLGQLLSWIGSVLALASVFGIALRLTRSLLLAVLAGLLLIANRSFLEFAVLEGNDMLAAGIQLLAVYVVWQITPERDDHTAKRLSLVAGGVLGLGYLFRYTALTAVPCLLLALALKRRHQPRHVLHLAILLCSAFTVAAAVQIVPALIAYGTPFYNTQAKNVWFGIYGNQDWVTNWGAIPPTITLGEVIAIDPLRFVTHWWTEFARAFTSLRLWSLPLHLAWIAGGVVVALTRRLDLGDRALLLAALLLPTLATALAWLAPRFLLVPLLIQPLLIVALIGWVAERLPLARPYQLATGAAAAALLIGLGQAGPTSEWLRTPGLTFSSRVTALLRLAGMQEPASVATNDWLLHEADTDEHSAFVQLFTVLPYPASLDELLAKPQVAGMQYLVLNYQSGTGDFSAIQPDALADKQHLAPLSLDPRETIFCVQPCQIEASTPDQITFANGMQLIGHRLRTADQRASLYLYWRADQALTEDYVVSLRVLDAQGKVVAQQEGLPQLGTYPTSSWQPGTPIVDYHLLERAVPGPGRYRLELSVYQQHSGQPVAATRVGAQPATTIVVQEFAR